MKCLLSTSLLLLFCFMISAQVLIKHWDKRYGTSTRDFLFAHLHQTSDGGYILGGFTDSGISGDKTQPGWGNDDFWIVKVDSLGKKQWDRRFGGTGSDGLTALETTRDGGYILCGDSGSDISGDKTQPVRGGGDYWVVKIDSVGNKQWDKRFGGTLRDIPYSIIQTNDCGYLLGGYSNSGLSGDKSQDNWDTLNFYDDYWVVKIDSLGNKQWDRRFGGTDQDGLTSLLQTKDGGYLLGGTSASDSSGDKTQAAWGKQIWAYWIVKIDSAGNKQWDRRFGGQDGELLYDMDLTKDGGYILGGSSYSGIGGDKTEIGDYWIVKVDSEGNKQWDKGFYGSSGLSELYGISQTLDNGYLLSGRSAADTGGDKSEDNLGNGQIWIIKTDSVGNKQWDKTIFTTSTDAYCYAIETKDTCYVVKASIESQIGGYVTEPNRGNDLSEDYWIAKFCFDLPNNTIISNDNAVVKVYPNPFATNIIITLHEENLTQATFTITNIQGQVIFQKEENNIASYYTKMLDLNYLPNGIYFIEVVIDETRVVEQVIKH